jgi:hypothetical protein
LKEDIPPIERYRFAAQGTQPVCPFVAKGLADQEPEHCWTVGQSVRFEIPLTGGVRSALFENVGACGYQSVGVYVNGEFLKGYFFNKEVPQQTIHVYFTPLHNPAVVEFRIPYACRPGKHDPSSTDPRELGLSLKTVAIYSSPFPTNNGLAEVPTIDDRVKGAWKSHKAKDSFSLVEAQRFKTAVVELEEALDTYVAANNVARADIWQDEFNNLDRVRNKATLACETALLVERLTSEWKAGDCTTPKPVIIANAISAILGNTYAYLLDLERCVSGKLEDDINALRVRAYEAAERLLNAKLDELITGVKGDDLKLHAIAIKSLEQMVPKPAFRHYAVHVAALSAAGITFKSPEEIVDEMQAIELPVITKLQLVQRILKSME